MPNCWSSYTGQRYGTRSDTRPTWAGIRFGKRTIMSDPENGLVEEVRRPVAWSDIERK